MGELEVINLKEGQLAWFYGSVLAVWVHGVGGWLGLTCCKVSLASNGGRGQERQGGLYMPNDE